MENPIEKWVQNDKKLYRLLVEIQKTANTPTEMAELAFEKLCELYDIPRMPADIVEGDNYGNEDEEDEVFDKRSLFEEHAMIKYLSNENDDPRGMVLSAAWHILNNFPVDLKQVAEKGYGENIPDRCQIGLRGEGINGEVVFPQKEGKSWFELGCIVNHLVIDIE